MKMNSSSEPVEPASYTPLEYRETGEPCSFTESGQGMLANQPRAVESKPDPEALFATRLEAERRAVNAQARQDAEREIQRVRAEIARAIEQFAQQRDEYFRHAESEVVSLALAIARRLLHRETQIDPRLLSGLVNYELDQLDNATSVRLLVSPQTLSYWNAAAPTMSHPVEVAPDKTLAAGAVRIETALGSTVVSFDSELKEIERGFFDLLSHRPSPQETTTARVQ
jgi:flagellar assembly protein FliH